MKKIKYIIFVMLAMFIYSGEVSAGSATCTYEHDFFTVVVNYKYGVKAATEVLPKPYRGEEDVTVYIENTDIVKDEKIGCPNLRTDKIIVKNKQFRYELHVDEEGDLKGIISNLVEDGAESEKTTNKVCKYNSGKDNAEFTAQYGDKLIIELTGKTIKDYDWEYALNSREFTKNDFENGNCPQIHIHCIYKQNVDKCYISSSSDFGFTDGDDIVTEDPDTGESDSNGGSEDDKVVTNGETIKILKTIYNIIKILIPVLIILLSAVDFLKILIADDEKNYKLAWDRFVKRLMVGVIFFIVPVLVSFLLKYSGIETEQTFLEIFK